MKDAVFTMKLEPDLRDAFAAEAASQDRSAAQVVRELMRSYVQRRQRVRDRTGEYNEFLRAKVELARVSMRAGRGRSNEDVEADFAARRRKQASPA